MNAGSVNNIPGEEQRFRNHELIGEGAYGTVYSARDSDGKRVALKVIRITANESDGIPLSTLREISNLKKIEAAHHPNIVKLYDVIFARRGYDVCMYLVFELCEYDLAKYIETFKQEIDAACVKSITRQLFSAIDYLHSEQIVHRDLKPQNVLIGRDRIVRVADFGLSRVVGSSNAVTTTVVTLWYRAPEILLRSPYSSAVDVFSLGCILAELHLKRPLLAGDSEVGQLQRYFEVCGLPNAADWPPASPFDLEAFRLHLKRSLPSTSASSSRLSLSSSSLASAGFSKPSLRRHVPGLCESGLALLAACLEFRPARRILARDALRHAYFADEPQSTASSSYTSTPLCVPEQPVGAASNTASTSAGPKFGSSPRTNADLGTDVLNNITNAFRTSAATANSESAVSTSTMNGPVMPLPASTSSNTLHVASCKKRKSLSMLDNGTHAEVISMTPSISDVVNKNVQDAGMSHAPIILSSAKRLREHGIAPGVGVDRCEELPRSSRSSLVHSVSETQLHHLVPHSATGMRLNDLQNVHIAHELGDVNEYDREEVGDDEDDEVYIEDDVSSCAEVSAPDGSDADGVGDEDDEAESTDDDHGTALRDSGSDASV